MLKNEYNYFVCYLCPNRALRGGKTRFCIEQLLQKVQKRQELSDVGYLKFFLSEGQKATGVGGVHCTVKRPSPQML